MKIFRTIIGTVIIAGMLPGISGCAPQGITMPAEPEADGADATTFPDSPEWVGKLDEAKDAKQLFVVAGVSGTTAYVSMHGKDESGNWKQIITTPGYIGKYGLGKTKEGDGKTPVGVFRFTKAFGIADDPGCRIPYEKVGDDEYWSGDQRCGHEYNEMVNIKDIPDLDTKASEHIVDYNVHYQYCMNIGYNEEDIPGDGSAVFLHCLGPDKPYTGGCVAIPKDKMITVLKNVEADCVVVIDTLKNISPELYDSWGIARMELSSEVSPN